MIRALVLAALIGLSACAAAPDQEAAADPNLAFALGHDLTCDAGDMQLCPPGGCAAGVQPEAMTLYISLLVPDRGGDGRFCIGSGCEEAVFAPTLTRALGWTARMRTRDITHYDAELEISRDLRSFTLRQGDADGVRTWSGVCNAAGS